MKMSKQRTYLTTSMRQSRLNKKLSRRQRKDFISNQHDKKPLPHIIILYV